MIGVSKRTKLLDTDVADTFPNVQVMRVFCLLGRWEGWVLFLFLSALNQEIYSCLATKVNSCNL